MNVANGFNGLKGVKSLIEHNEVLAQVGRSYISDWVSYQLDQSPLTAKKKTNSPFDPNSAPHRPH